MSYLSDWCDICSAASISTYARRLRLGAQCIKHFKRYIKIETQVYKYNCLPGPQLALFVVLPKSTAMAPFPESIRNMLYTVFFAVYLFRRTQNMVDECANGAIQTITMFTKICNQYIRKNLRIIQSKLCFNNVSLNFGNVFGGSLVASFNR